MYETSEYYSDEHAMERDMQLRHLDGLIEHVDERLAAMQPGINVLMDIRHRLYDLPSTLLTDDRPASEQLYTEPTYNDVFVYGADNEGKGGDLDTRRGKEFHQGESYDEGEYADAIFAVASDLGFVRHEVLTASNPLDERIGIADSALEPVGVVDAVIVPGARSWSNVMRIIDAVRNIESGRVETDTIIFAATDRPTDEAEHEKLASIGFRGGATEFESMIIAFNDLTGNEVDPSQTIDYPVGLTSGEYIGKILQSSITIEGATYELIAVSAPFDPERTLSNGKKANRANTDETFIAVNQLLAPGLGSVLIESHDTWAQAQGVIGQQIFGLSGKDVVVTGPQKLERITREDGENGRPVLSKPQEVVDEIAKTYSFLTQTRIKAENAKAKLFE